MAILSASERVSRPKLLDLFCKAGGAGMGYYRAGFDVVGVDIERQAHYPFEFYQADALAFCAEHGHEYDVIHASPPCQIHSQTRFLMRGRKPKHEYVNLIPQTREALRATGKPYVIENVEGAPLENPLMLCGSMFGLGTLRHRLFETNPVIWWPPMCCSHDRVLPMWWRSRKKALAEGKTYRYICVAGQSFLIGEAKRAMGIDWMNRAEIAQAIPPAYTEWLGRVLMGMLGLDSLALKLSEVVHA